MAAQNGVFRLMRREFRTFAHPPEAMLAVLEGHGHRPVYARPGVPFRVVGLERAA